MQPTFNLVYTVKRFNVCVGMSVFFYCSCMSAYYITLDVLVQTLNSETVLLYLEQFSM